MIEEGGATSYGKKRTHELHDDLKDITELESISRMKTSMLHDKHASAQTVFDNVRYL